jgi:hypothetical protein
MGIGEARLAWRLDYGLKDGGFIPRRFRNFFIRQLILVYLGRESRR